MWGVVGIVLSLLLLIYLAYRDVSVLVLAPLCALVAVVLDGHLPVLAASGGLSIALKSFGETYYERALAVGIDPQLLHRVASMSCGGLDSLPHNGAVITLLLICGVTHRQGYKDIAAITILIPVLATIAVLVLGSTFGSF